MPNRLPADLPQAFQQEFERHWLAVFRFAVGWTNDWAAGEDLAQEAFARLWTRRHDIDWSSSTLPWLLTATRHLATDRFRRLRRIAFFASPESALDGDARLRWLDVQAALTELTPMQRGALVLTAVLGFDSGQPPKSFKRHPAAFARRSAGHARF